MAQGIPDYSGPTVKDMIANHTIAENVIKHHHKAGNEIFDSSELALLRRFVNNPAARDLILADSGMSDDEQGQGLGNRALRQGSLAGYIVARHGAGTDDMPGPILTADEIATLKDWFASGAADQALGPQA